MGDFLMDLDPAQDCYEACDARVTCFCVATDDDNIFEVFECVTQRNDITPPTMTNAPADVTIACTDDLPAPPTPMFADNCTDECAPTWALTGTSLARTMSVASTAATLLRLSSSPTLRAPSCARGTPPMRLPLKAARAAAR